MSVIKLIALLIAAGLGLYFGQLVGSIEFRHWDFDYWAMRPNRYILGFASGVGLATLALPVSRLVKFPDLAVLVVSFALSFIRPIAGMLQFGDPLRLYPVFMVWLASLPAFFAGVFAVFGVALILTDTVLPIFRGNDT